jgi:hypothetical protein
MPRVQFSLKTMLWMMALAGAFFGGMGLQKRLDQPRIQRPGDPPLGGLADGSYAEILRLPDGTEWSRWVYPSTQQ